jgi:hypothetical protein
MTSTVWQPGAYDDINEVIWGWSINPLKSKNAGPLGMALIMWHF